MTTQPIIGATIATRYYQGRFYFRLPQGDADSQAIVARHVAPSEQVKGQFVMSNPVPTQGELASALKCLADLGWIHGFMEYTWTAPSAETLQADFNEFIEARS